MTSNKENKPYEGGQSEPREGKYGWAEAALQGKVVGQVFSATTVNACLSLLNPIPHILWPINTDNRVIPKGSCTFSCHCMLWSAVRVEEVKKLIFLSKHFERFLTLERQAVPVGIKTSVNFWFSLLLVILATRKCQLQHHVTSAGTFCSSPTPSQYPLHPDGRQSEESRNVAHDCGADDVIHTVHRRLCLLS